MKYRFLFFFLNIVAFSYGQFPKGFVYLRSVVPEVEVDLRYFTSNNFVGTSVDSYKNDCLIVTEQTARALHKVQQELKKRGLGLKVYDGYRPQQAVNHFVRWARVLHDTLRKPDFYPNVKKKDLFKEGYIASHSGHTKGSTIDLTLIDLATKKELDMGSVYDFFGVESWVAYKGLTKVQSKNRMVLQEVMLKYGFRNYAREWWHFTLRGEPFPKTYFDFPIE